MEIVTHTTLSRATLDRIPIAKPAYDRDRVTVGIVHFGVGGFHRAHQAMYIDRLLEKGAASEWGICGVGVMPADRRMKDVMDAQDGLYTLVLENPDGSREPRVIGSIVDYLYAPDDPEAVIELLAAPTTRIISLTITEGGYNVENIDPGEVSVFGLVAEALARRRDRGVVSPTIVSCDNIEGNGNVAREAFTTYAERVHPGLAEWMSENTRFPNSMVDRITPATTSDVIAGLKDEFGVEDQWPVVAEPFTSWVLEDDFSDGRPPLEDADVLLVDDVTPYELMKLRLLNASHQSLCYFAYLSGYRLVHDAAGDPLFADFLMRYMDTEATPTLLPVPGIDLPDYKRTLIERFANPGVRDTIVRLCFGSSDRIRSGCFPSSARTWRPTDRCDCRRRRWPAGLATPRVSTNRASPSTSRISWPTSWFRSRSRRSTIRPRSSRTPKCSAISAPPVDSWRPTSGRWSRCTAMARGRRWRP